MATAPIAFIIYYFNTKTPLLSWPSYSRPYICSKSYYELWPRITPFNQDILLVTLIDYISSWKRQQR